MYFLTTHWSLLAKATLDGETEARAALAELCRRYWSPLNQFIRSRGYLEAEAEDLTQEFLVHLLEHSALRKPDPDRGRFRSFLLGALTKFLSHERERRLSLKRGGQLPHVSMATLGEGVHGPPPESEVASFDRAWALTIVKAAVDRVERDYAEGGKDRLFAVLRSFLPGVNVPPPYEQAATEAGMSVAAFTSEVHRLRGKLRELMCAEVMATVSAPHEMEDEIGYLYRVLMDRATDFGPGRKDGVGNP